jgi:hypothetical protein
MELPYYYFEYHYDIYRACLHGSNCCDNDYCRCGEIINTQITSVDLSKLLEATMNEVDKKRKYTEVERYCIGRILIQNKMHDLCNYELVIGGGYYGQEIIGVNCHNLRSCIIAVRKMLMLPNDDAKLKFIIHNEYGYLLDEMKDVSFELKEVRYKDILPPIDLRRIDGESYDFNSAIGIYKRVGDDKYRIVDGHHRWKNAEGNEIVKIFVY